MEFCQEPGKPRCMWPFVVLDDSSVSKRTLTRQEIIALYRKYRGLVKDRCQRLVRDHALAEDACQQTFIKLIDAELPYRKPKDHLYWAYRIGEQTSIDMWKKQRNRSHLEKGKTLPLADVICEGSATADPFRRLENRDMLTQFIAKLRFNERRLVQLRYFDGLNMETIAGRLGLSRQTVAKRLAKLQARARRLEEAANNV